MQVECRVREHTPDGITTQKETPGQTDGSEARRTLKGFSTPMDPQVDHLKKYLASRNLDKSNTEDNSFDRSYGRKVVRESINPPNWSGLKQNASTSRISTCPRLDSEGVEFSNHKSSHIFQKYAIQERRNMRKSINYVEDVKFTSRNQECSSPSNFPTFREAVPEARYKVEYNFFHPSDRVDTNSGPVTSRNVYRSCDRYRGRLSSRQLY